MNKRFTILLVLLLAVSSLLMVQSAFASVAQPSVPEFTVNLVSQPYDVPTTYSIDRYTGENITHLGYHVENKSIELSVKNQPLVWGENYTLYYDVRAKGGFEENWTGLYSYSPTAPGSLPPQSSSQYTMLSFPANYPDGSKVDFQVEAVLVNHYKFRTFSDDWLAQHPLASTLDPNLEDIYEEEVHVVGTSGGSDTQTVSFPSPPLTSTSDLTPETTTDEPLQTLQLGAIIAAISIVMISIALLVYYEKTQKRKSSFFQR